MADKLNVQLMIGQWIKKVILAFIMCALTLLCLSMFITHYDISEKYLAVALLLCCAYYLYQIFLILKIRCPKCKKALIFSLFSGNFPLSFKSYTVKKCNNCGKEFE
jgi:hypothetical protein